MSKSTEHTPAVVPLATSNSDRKQPIRKWEVLKTGSAVMSFGASIVASTALSVGGVELPWTIHENDREYTYLTGSEGLPHTEVQSYVSTVSRPSIEETNFAVNVMPFSTSFNLANDPEAQRFLGENGLPEYADHLQSLLDDGYEIASVQIVGYASDEAIGIAATDGGVGQANIENIELAQGRAEFMLEALKHELDGVSLGDVQLSGEEKVVSGDIALRIKEISLAHGYESTEAFVYDYAMGKVALSGQDLALMQYQFDQNRGARVTIMFERPGETTTYTDKDEVCVRHDVYFEQSRNVQGGIVTILPVPIPLLRRRRTDKNDMDQGDDESGQIAPVTPQEATTPDVEADAADVPGSEADSAESDSVDEERNGVTVRSGDDAQITPSELTRATLRSSVARAPRAVRPRTGMERWVFKPSRARRIGGKVVPLLIPLLVLSVTRPEFGYCPDKDDTTHNPFHMDLPEYVALTVHIPFTDAAGDVTTVLVDVPCDDAGANGDGMADNTVCEVERIDLSIHRLDGTIETSSNIAP